MRTITKIAFNGLLFFTLLVNNVNAQDLYPFDEATERAQFYELTQQIRCVVCQNQNIADSNAPLAGDLRAKVYEMVLAKKTDQEIKTYLVTRYGDFILLEPRLNPLTGLLWFFPAVGILFIIFVFVRLQRS